MTSSEDPRFRGSEDESRLRASSARMSIARMLCSSGSLAITRRTIAVVDATLSEVAKMAERTLYYSSSSPAFVRSHTGLLSLLQALAYGVYARDAAQYDDRIRAFKLK